MRRFKGVLLAGMLMLSMSVPVYADRSAVVKVEPPAESTDYYMTVDSGGIGVDIYPSTDGKSEKMNDKTVKDGTVLHIEGETEKNGETWGYTEYNGRHGYVPLDELRPSKDTELAAAGVTEGKDSGAAQTPDGNTQGTATSNAADKVTGTPAADKDNGKNNAGNEADSISPAADSNAVKDGTNEADGQNTNAADADKESTNVASNAESSSEGEVQGPPAVSGSAASTDEAVKNNGEDAQDGEETAKPVNGTAATSFKEENPWYKSPFIWIGIVTVLAVIGILGYHVKKR